MSKIIVIGSSNIDMVACLKSLPKPGETIGGARLTQANGGKGANQAVAAARLGGDVVFLTCLGNDSNGNMLKENFKADGIDTSFIKITDKVPTGAALIFVDENAENCIAVAPGANDELFPEDVDKISSVIDESGYMLMQLEIPIDTVIHAVDTARANNIKAILNPAPMKDIPDDTLSKLYLITPNETEAEKLTGIAISSIEDAARAADALLAKGVSNVIITLGSQGSLICTPQGKELVPARKVNAVDTTAAGDVYNGALVAALSEGMTLSDAAVFATKASAISVTRLGAQPSVPFRSEIQ